MLKPWLWMPCNLLLLRVAHCWNWMHGARTMLDVLAQAQPNLAIWSGAVANDDAAPAVLSANSCTREICDVLVASLCDPPTAVHH
jgi:hypothetical protein